jgi:hypothetical protein
MARHELRSTLGDLGADRGGARATVNHVVVHGAAW